jgi:hypothetical protein
MCTRYVNIADLSFLQAGANSKLFAPTTSRGPQLTSILLLQSSEVSQVQVCSVCTTNCSKFCSERYTLVDLVKRAPDPQKQARATRKGSHKPFHTHLHILDTYSRPFSPFLSVFWAKRLGRSLRLPTSAHAPFIHPSYTLTVSSRYCTRVFGVSCCLPHEQYKRLSFPSAFRPDLLALLHSFSLTLSTYTGHFQAITYDRFVSSDHPYAVGLDVNLPGPADVSKLSSSTSMTLEVR